MRRVLAASLIAISLSATVQAGDVPFPGKQEPTPPACTQNCTGSASTTDGEATAEDELQALLIEIILILVTVG